MENDSIRTRRVRRKPEQIRELLKEYKQSGKSVEEFAAEQGIAVSTVWAWRRRYRASPQIPSPRWVEVDNASAAIQPRAMAQVRMSDGLSIELNPGFEVPTVAALIDQLRKG